MTGLNRKGLSLSTPPGAPRTFFFGWSIVGFTFMTQFTVGGMFYTYGVLQKPLSEALEVDRFAVSLAFSLQTLVVAVLSPWVGKLILRTPIRKVLAFGLAALLLGFVGFGQVRHLWHLYLAFGLLLAVASTLIGPLPSNAMIANWFVKRRGTALGISQLGISISGAVMVPIVSWLVETQGWRWAVTSMGLGLSAVLIPLVWKVAVFRPEDKGLLPDGQGVADSADGRIEPVSAWTFARALRDRRIWLLVAIVGPSFFGVGAVLLALHAHFTDMGLSAAQASSVVALATLMAALAKPLFGVLADVLNQRLLMAAALASQIVGLSLIVMLANPAGLMVAAFFYGLGYGAGMPMWTVFIGTLFGRAAFARVMGLMTPLTTPFTLFGFPFASLVFDATGSYQAAFVTVIVGIVLSIGAVGLLRLPEVSVARAGAPAR
ncbi:MAG: MFS transporter [Gammaproteobacteria bacterium]|nr:MFS transporter [Gammaproteobacteria bacterium]MYK83407.1 MFS transporter [Gammaproteobacteria bacterium]